MCSQLQTLLFLLILLERQCKSTWDCSTDPTATTCTCLSGSCSGGCNNCDGKQYVCTNTADSCTLICNSGSQSCNGVTMFAAPAAISTSNVLITCNAANACNNMTVYIGSITNGNPLPINNYYSFGESDFNGYINDVLININSNYAVTQNSYFSCNGDVKQCRLNSNGNTETFTNSIFSCTSSRNDALCWLDCGNDGICDSSTYICTAPTCSCYGSYCHQLSQFITNSPTQNPTPAPTNIPTPAPTTNPTPAPTNIPSKTPTKNPSKSPTKYPTPAPTANPTRLPTKTPSKSPTKFPTLSPTNNPSHTPTKTPSNNPTHFPSKDPTTTPTHSPSKYPTHFPSKDPTKTPTYNPSKYPTRTPTLNPTLTPSRPPSKSISPTSLPTTFSKQPTKTPTSNPTNNPTYTPTLSMNPTEQPTYLPTISPTNYGWNWCDKSGKWRICKYKLEIFMNILCEWVNTVDISFDIVFFILKKYIMSEFIDNYNVLLNNIDVSILFENDNQNTNSDIDNMMDNVMLNVTILLATDSKNIFKNIVLFDDMNDDTYESIENDVISVYQNSSFNIVRTTVNLNEISNTKTDTMNLFQPSTYNMVYWIIFVLIVLFLTGVCIFCVWWFKKNNSNRKKKKTLGNTFAETNIGLSKLKKLTVGGLKDSDNNNNNTGTYIVPDPSPIETNDGNNKLKDFDDDELNILNTTLKEE